jgi:UrcA family protein
MTVPAAISCKAVLLWVAVAWQCNALAATVPRDPDSAQVTVHLVDLDLDRPADVAILYDRIRSAAERVCGEPKPIGSRLTRASWRNCVAQSVLRAVATLDRPTLTAYYRLHSVSLIPAS